MKKLIYAFNEIEPHPYAQFWQEHLPEEFAKLEIQTQNQGEDEIRKSWKALLAKPDASLMSWARSSTFFQALPKLPRRILESHMIDAVVKDKAGNLWPHCLMRDALHTMIVRRVPSLDTHAIAYVVGADHLMRMAVSVVVQLGFEGINIVIDDPQAHAGLQQDLERTYFDTDIRIIKSSELTLQKNNGTVLVNTIPLEEREELIEDLSYLNFILSDGLVIDTTLFPLKNHLLDEAEHVGLSTISGAELLAERDWSFLSHLWARVSLTSPQYHERWLDFLRGLEKQKNPVEGPVTK